MRETHAALQFGDDPPTPFSFMNDKVWIEPGEQLECHLTYTDERAHKIIADNMHVNRHVREEVTGPRYKQKLSIDLLKQVSLLKIKLSIKYCK